MGGGGVEGELREVRTVLTEAEATSKQSRRERERVNEEKEVKWDGVGNQIKRGALSMAKRETNKEEGHTHSPTHKRIGKLRR